MDGDGERSSPSWAWAHSRRISTVTRLISLVNHHLGNRADRIYSEVNVYTQLIYLEVGWCWGRGGWHQCFICSCLWIFQQQRCSNARRGLLRGFVWYKRCLLCMQKALLQGALGHSSLFLGFFSPSLIQGACLTLSYCLHLFGFSDLLRNFYILRCVSSPATPLRTPQCPSRLCEM